MNHKSWLSLNKWRCAYTYQDVWLLCHSLGTFLTPLNKSSEKAVVVTLALAAASPSPLASVSPLVSGLDVLVKVL